MKEKRATDSASSANKTDLGSADASSQRETPALKAVDLGCGPNKHEGCLGVDRHPYPGVDIIHDLDITPWPIETDSCRLIYAHHIIEHVASVPAFMSEVHRIGAEGARVDIMTPHFSSINSWDDPTHRWHLSCLWHESFTANYLGAQMPSFEAVSYEIQFGSGLRGLIAKSICSAKGYRWWERHFAFVHGARNIHTVLRVRKHR